MNDREVALLAYQAMDGAIRSLIATHGLLKKALDSSRDAEDPEWEPPMECVHMDRLVVATMGAEQSFCKTCGDEVDP
jgi:hypothetical protein